MGRMQLRPRIDHGRGRARSSHGLHARPPWPPMTMHDLARARTATWLALVLAGCNAAPGTSTADGPSDGSSTDGGDASGSASSPSSGPGTGDATSGSSTSTEGSSSASATDASDDSSGGPIAGGPCYQPDSHPWAGTLCGTTAQPCQIVVAEVIDPAPAIEEFEHFRHGAPSITHDEGCAPIVGFGATVAPDDVHGVLARRRGDDDWQQVERPLVASTTVAWDAGLHLLRLIEGRSTGAVAHSTYDADTDAFAVAPSTARLLPDARSLGNGRWQAVARDPSDDTALHLLRFADDTWTDDVLAIPQLYDATVELSDDDAGHVLFRAAHGDAWGLFYAAPPYDAQEFVLDLQSREYVMAAFDLAMAHDRPHAIAVRSDLDTGVNDLVYLSRGDDGAWNVRVFATNDPAQDVGCPDPVLGAPTCEFVDVARLPEAIVASHGGDVRIFWHERLRTGTAEVTCVEPDAPCEWTTTAQETLHTTWITAPTDDGFDTTMLLDRDFRIGDIDIDGTGNIHIVGDTLEATGTRVDYLRLAL